MLNCDFNGGNGLTDPKSISKNIKMISVADDTIKICRKALFMPPLTPHLEIVFWPALPHFSTDFIKKRCQIVQEIILHQIQAALTNLKHHPFIDDLY